MAGSFPDGFQGGFPCPLFRQPHPSAKRVLYDGLSQDKQAVRFIAGQRGDKNPEDGRGVGPRVGGWGGRGKEKGWGGEGSVGKTWEPNTGWALTKDPSAQGLTMSTWVSALERLVSDANKNGAQTTFLSLRFGRTVISHPGAGISYLVAHIRESSPLPFDNNNTQREFHRVFTFLPRTA